MVFLKSTMVPLRIFIAEWASKRFYRRLVSSNSTYMSDINATLPIDILTFIILYNNLIPISLIVTMEVVKFQQAQLINSDLDMYYAKTDTPALCRTSSLVEELGQIEYVFSDKTGTLTCNEMEFRCCSIGGIAFADVVDENKRGDGEDGKESDGWRTFDEMKALLDEPSNSSANPFLDNVAPSDRDRHREVVREFLTLLAVCHTVIPEVKDGKTVYQASSPDEAALVAGAELLGFQFHVSYM
jgi:phospholipid-transporting ATPase